MKPVTKEIIEFEPVIGLEVHAELMTKSKMFCGCAVVDSVSAPPNTAVCPVCAGMPGTLPVVNQKAVEYAIRVALWAAPSTRSAYLPVRTISTPTCPRATRSHSMSNR